MKTSQAARNPRTARRKRHGTTMVEMAVVLPVFLIFIFGIVEYGRVQMVSNMLKNACRTASRQGSTEGATTASVETRVSEIMSSVMDTSHLTVIVKNADVFDDGGTLPTSSSEITAMPDIDLADAEPRQLFLVRASVGYDDVAIFPFASLVGAQLSGQSFMRHE